MTGPRTAGTASCRQCRIAVDLCAFCQKEDCPHPMCYRCVRIVLRQEIPQPHVHGGCKVIGPPAPLPLLA